MVDIYRTNNPAEYDDLDGIVIDEQAPPPSVQGVAANVAILVGRFQRGPIEELTRVGSIGELHELFGKGYEGNDELKQRRFGILKLIRVGTSGQVAATKTFQDVTPEDAITFEALYKGAYGNSLKVTIETGSSSGKKYTFSDTNSGAVILPEVYDNVSVIGKTQAQLDVLFAGSKLIKPVVVAGGASLEPENAAATALATGSDGTVANTDYESAIQVALQQKAGNVMWCDQYDDTIKGYLEQHVLDAPDKIVVIGPDSADVDEDAAITDVADYHDVEGRIIYAFNPIEIQDGAVKKWTSAASWVASIISQTSPHVDPAYTANTAYTLGGLRVKYQLSRDKYKQLMAAGIAAFEQDTDLGGSGIVLKSGIVTQIADPNKVMIHRRRMADFLTDSVGLFLKFYKSAPNTAANRREVKGSIIGWDDGLIRDGIVPNDSEVEDGLARIVDVESLNTNATIGAGQFRIKYKRRIYSSMRFIVLVAEIGEQVVVTEGE